METKLENSANYRLYNGFKVKLEEAKKTRQGRTQMLYQQVLPAIRGCQYEICQGDDLFMLTGVRNKQLSNEIDDILEFGDENGLLGHSLASLAQEEKENPASGLVPNQENEENVVGHDILSEAKKRSSRRRNKINDDMLFQSSNGFQKLKTQVVDLSLTNNEFENLHLIVKHWEDWGWNLCPLNPDEFVSQVEKQMNKKLSRYYLDNLLNPPLVDDDEAVVVPEEEEETKQQTALNSEGGQAEALNSQPENLASVGNTDNLYFDDIHFEDDFDEPQPTPANLEDK